MLIYLLFAIFVVMLYLAYIKFDKDIITPAFVLVSGYTFSIICAIANIEAWAIVLQWQTVGVLTYGTGLFVVTGYFIKEYMHKKYVTKQSEQRILELIKYNKRHVKLFCVFQILVMMAWVYNIYHVTSQLGDYKTFFEMMVAFRHWSGYSTEWMGNLTYNVLYLFVKISTMSSYVVVYISINNFFYKKVIDKMLFITLMLSVLQMVLTGARGEIVGLVIIAVYFYLSNYHYFYDRFYRISFGAVIKLMVFAIVCALLFYYGKGVVGRGNSDIKFSNMIPYLTMYAGGPIQLLDMFLVEPIASSDILGKETFAGLNNYLARLKFVDFAPYIPHLEFRNATTGVFLGNVYTAYRSYIYDFGYIGLTILPIIFSFVVHFLYYKILLTRKYPLNCWMLLYALIFPYIFFDFARCLFFTVVMSFGTLMKMVILVCLSYIFVDGFDLRKVMSRGG